MSKKAKKTTSKPEPATPALTPEQQALLKQQEIIAAAQANQTAPSPAPVSVERGHSVNVPNIGQDLYISVDSGKGPRLEAPPEFEPADKLMQRAKDLFGLKDEQVVKCVKISKDTWVKMGFKEHREPVKIVTVNGRKLIFAPGAEWLNGQPHVCYVCGESIKDGWLDQGSAGIDGHPFWYHLHAHCAHGVIHGNTRLADISMYVESQLDRSALRAKNAATKLGILKRG